jgi:hypothetical protein
MSRGSGSGTYGAGLGREGLMRRRSLRAPAQGRLFATPEKRLCSG